MQTAGQELGRRLRTLSPSDLEAPQRWIGRGGFGDIYRSRMWGLDVALKLVRGTRQTAKKLLEEARLMEQAQSPFVLPLLGFYSKPEEECVNYGLVIQYMPNGSLSTLFNKVSPVPWALRFQFIHQVASGMHYLHDLRPPLLHLDLKRSNVLLDENLKVQLADFGLSKSKNITASLSTGNMAGTLAYMPPEAFVYGTQKKESFDIYSFGVLMWTVLAEKEPFEGDSKESLWDNTLVHSRGGLQFRVLSGQIQLSVPDHQRPNLEPLESQRNVKMVPEAIDLIKQCWHQEPALRPPFKICTRKTSDMLHAYEDEVEDAVRYVKDKLKKKQAEENQKTATEDTQTVEAPSTSLYTESFHPSRFKTMPVVTPTPSIEPSAIIPPQHKTTELQSPAYQNGVPKTGSEQEFLRENFLRLRDEIPSVQPLLDQLKREKIFNREEVETILAKETPTDRIRTMLNDIMKKGKHSSQRFYYLLKENYPNLMRSLEDV